MAADPTPSVAVRAPARRLLIVAAAGYGKTTAAAAAHPHRRGLLAEDVDALGAAEFAALVERIRGAGPDVPVVVTARCPLSPDRRAALPGIFYERGPPDLALSQHRIAQVLRDEYAVTDPEAAPRVHDATLGWPMLVHFAADLLARRQVADVAGALAEPGSAAERWLWSSVLGVLPDELRAALRTLGRLDPLLPELWRELAPQSGPEAPPDGLEHLLRVGIVAPSVRGRLTGGPEVAVVPVVRALLQGDESADPCRALLTLAGDWYAAHGYPFGAARARAESGDLAEAGRLLAGHGLRILANGDARGVIELAEQHPELLRDTEVAGTYAEALHVCGRLDRARAAYGPLVRAADAGGWDARTARRLAALAYSEGELPEALATLDRVPAERVGTDVDAVIWHSVRANLASLVGSEEAAAQAARALDLAAALPDRLALVHAHQAMAKVCTGARKEAHLSRALSAARACGDVFDIARILGNQGYALLAAARFGEAVGVCREAAVAAFRARPTGAQTVATLHNLGEALLRTGEFDDAGWQLRRAVAMCRREMPGSTGIGMLGLGELHRSLGQREQARAAYTEVIALASGTGELQVLVPALAGLTRVLLPEDPGAARAAATEAMTLATGPLTVVAAIAHGYVQLGLGDLGAAVGTCAHAVDSARADGSLDLLADALELAGTVALARGDTGGARAAFDQSWSIWRDGGAGPFADRVEVLRSRLPGSDPAARSRGREAAKRLRQFGIHEVGGQSTESLSSRRVLVRVLGRFSVEVDGAEVPLVAWRSRQARTLVKLLAARRGRPVSRGEVCETLWPDDDPTRTSHRLSVLLATVRTVLDPAKAHPADQSIGADGRGLWLDLRQVGLDADDLLTDTNEAIVLLETGETDRALEILQDIHRRYPGAAFEDEPYEAWADALREETRAAWLRCMRHLAMTYSRAGRAGDAEALFVRMLHVDPYDERVHGSRVRSLLRAGRYGEARRAFERWRSAMAEVDAPAPDPALLDGRTGTARSDATLIPRQHPADVGPRGAGPPGSLRSRMDTRRGRKT